MNKVRIGTSGWHYDHWRGRFYDADTPASEMLSFYVRQFDTVEINNSFYRLPTEEDFEAWRDSTPGDFLFAVKASRFITHNKKLNDPQSALENFIPRAEILGRKLGLILFQLPPRWHVNAERLESFLKMLPKRHRYTFEMRDATWHTQSIYKLLHKHNAAFCIYELAGFNLRWRLPPISHTLDCMAQVGNIRAAIRLKFCECGQGGLRPGWRG